ncbi:hypothetical protein [Ensifer aridi]|uniref:hypothetical protein n=1 Tax=Ensifer aridi TaxID=1708715 RepID=UPI00047EAB8D|nr:hypothetical protein [Ensifer aridi]
MLPLTARDAVAARDNASRPQIFTISGDRRLAQEADRVAQDIGARCTLAGDVDVSLVKNLVIALERRLLLLQKADEVHELCCERAVCPFDTVRVVNMGEIARADRVELLLGRAAAQRGKVLRQLRVRAEIGFVIEFVVAR